MAHITPVVLRFEIPWWKKFSFSFMYYYRGSRTVVKLVLDHAIENVNSQKIWKQCHLFLHTMQVANGGVAM